MKVNTIDIKGVGGISELSLTFNPNVNILCGPNSIGKTTVLECIAHSFSTTSSQVLKRNVNAPQGFIKTTACQNEETKTIELIIREFNPDKQNQAYGIYEWIRQVIVVKTTRNFGYSSLNAISRDGTRDNRGMSISIENGVSIGEAKNWFINRFMFLDKEGSLTKSQIDNYNLAKACFSVLNPEYSFSRVKGDTFDIMINTPHGEIYYEYLSTGFKSILYILYGIIQEIEFRFKSPMMTAADFDGIILIDEIELHLHPEWQARIVKALTSIFPKAQFFLTTHSPHVIQTAQPNQIIALEETADGVKQRELPNPKYGYQGWTVEEILQDVMGMHDTRTDVFNDAINEFEQALKEDSREGAQHAYERISDMLHPTNVLRKLLQIQMAGVGVKDFELEE